jgi:serine/threonine protein kinase/Tol biopolymer transport system component
MLAERWQEIERLYHSTLEQSPEDRGPYLEKACGGDEALRREVESMLASDDLAVNFLESKEPQVDEVAPDARKTAGAQIGSYMILEFLRAGGMGEVYKARDTRLDRIVAIKFLPATIAPDAVALERFHREARAASALNHPHICTVHDVGDHEGRPFIVMEFLEGGSLRDRIAGKPLPIPDLVNITLQVCEGLQAAHTKGIVHRDVKPANISITAAGGIKILDFGVAKVGSAYRAEASTSYVASDAAATKTLSPIHLTRAGTLMGTLAYLSPEQARGEEVDSRSDIFSLGAVMYEMATGRQPFHGETSTALVNAILTEHPNKPSELNAAVPKSLDRIIAKALAKDRAARYQSVEEMAGDLAGLATSHRHRFLVAVSALALLASLGTVIWFATRPGSGPRPQAFAQLTDNPGEELYPSIAADGKFFVYQSRASGKWEIYLKRVGRQNPISLTKDSAAEDTQPALSPDGELVAFRSERDGGGIFVMGATGDRVRRLTSFGYNPAWAPNGKEIVCSTGFFIRPEEKGNSNSQLFRVNIATGETLQISGIDDAAQPNWSPHGYRIAYWSSPRGPRDLWTVAPDGRDPVRITADVAVDWSPVWSPDGRYLYFSSDRGGSMNLWRVRIDEASGKTSGAPEPFTTPAQSSGFMSFSRDGRQMVYAAHGRDLNLYKVGFDPVREVTSGESITVTAGSTPLADPDFSPDGQWIVFNSHTTPQNLFLVRSDGTGLRQLTDGGQMDRCPKWSPDGSQIAFCSVRSGKRQIWTIKPDGSSLEKRTDAPGNGANLPRWLPDGRVSIYRAGVILDPAKGWKEQPLQRLPNPESGMRFAAAAWSPDGRMVSGELSQNNGSSLGLSVYHVDSRSYEQIGPPGGEGGGLWLPDSRRLLFLHDRKIHLIDSQSRRIHQVFTAGPRRDIYSFGLSADGRWIAYTVEAAESDVWQVKTEP